MNKPNRTLARLRLCRMQMRREGALLIQGKRTYTNAAQTDLEATFTRIREQMKRPTNVRAIERKRRTA